MKFEIKSSKRNSFCYSIKIDEMTEGATLALFNALQFYGENSPVAYDVWCAYRVALDIHAKDFPRLQQNALNSIELRKKRLEDSKNIDKIENTKEN